MYADSTQLRHAFAGNIRIIRAQDETVRVDKLDPESDAGNQDEGGEFSISLP
jgi:hypothetical protein